MRIENARQEIPNTLSFFSESFSRPSFKIFSSFIVSFIQLGKEVHTSSMVQSLAHSFLRRSLSSFTRFLGENLWTVEEVTETALRQFFQTLRITARDNLFLIVDDTLVKKTGKKMPGCGWHKDHAQNMTNVFGHQWVLSALQPLTPEYLSLLTLTPQYLKSYPRPSIHTCVHPPSPPPE